MRELLFCGSMAICRLQTGQYCRAGVVSKICRSAHMDKGLMDQALAPSTEKKYRTSVHLFASFCYIIGMKFSSALQNKSVDLWLIQLSKKRISHETIRLHLSALGHYSARHGIYSLLDTPCIQLLLKGIKKSSKQQTPPVTVATASHLKRLTMISKKMLRKREHLGFAVMISLAFYWFLRLSE